MWLTVQSLVDPTLPPKTVRINGIVCGVPDDDDDEPLPQPWAGARILTPLDHAEAAGYKEGAAGRPRSGCPWSLTSAEGKAWAIGWAIGVADIKELTGELEHLSVIARNEVRSSVQKDSTYRRDPTDVLDAPAPLTAAELEAFKVGSIFTEAADGFRRLADRLKDAGRAVTSLHARVAAADLPRNPTRPT